MLFGCLVEKFNLSIFSKNIEHSLHPSLYLSSNCQKRNKSLKTISVLIFLYLEQLIERNCNDYDSLQMFYDQEKKLFVVITFFAFSVQRTKLYINVSCSCKKYKKKCHKSSVHIYLYFYIAVSNNKGNMHIYYFDYQGNSFDCPHNQSYHENELFIAHTPEYQIECKIVEHALQFEMSVHNKYDYTQQGKVI